MAVKLKQIHRKGVHDEDDYKQADTAVGHHGGGQNNGDHGVLGTDHAGDGPGDGRGRAGDLHNFAE